MSMCTPLGFYNFGVLLCGTVERQIVQTALQQVPNTVLFTNTRRQSLFFPNTSVR